MYDRLAASPDEIARFCQRWRITEFSLFGSVLRDDYSEDSDIDVIVEFESACVPGLEYFETTSELSALLGRPADVVTRSMVERSENYVRRKEVLESAEIIYKTGWG